MNRQEFTKDLKDYVYGLKHTWKFKQDPDVVLPGTSWIKSVYYWWSYRGTLGEIRFVNQKMREMGES